MGLWNEWRVRRWYALISGNLLMHSPICILEIYEIDRLFYLVNILGMHHTTAVTDPRSADSLPGLYLRPSRRRIWPRKWRSAPPPSMAAVLDTRSAHLPCP